jgi:hypothetical protein
MITVWVLVILLDGRSYAGGAVTIEHATRESCLAAVRFVREQPTTDAVYCVPAARALR